MYPTNTSRVFMRNVSGLLRGQWRRETITVPVPRADEDEDPVPELYFYNDGDDLYGVEEEQIDYATRTVEDEDTDVNSTSVEFWKRWAGSSSNDSGIGFPSMDAGGKTSFSVASHRTKNPDVNLLEVPFVPCSSRLTGVWQGSISLTDASSRERLALAFVGLHFPANGTIYGYAEPHGYDSSDIPKNQLVQGCSVWARSWLW